MDEHRSLHRERPPHPALAAYVDRIWVSAARSDPGPRPILPDGCVDVLVDLREGGRAFVVGTMTKASVFAPEAPVRIVAVRFRPAGAAPWLGLPVADLTDRVVDAAELHLDWLSLARLDERSDLAHAARVLEEALLRRLPRVAEPDPLARRAVNLLLRPDPPSTEGLARTIGWTRQHLRRVFTRCVGVGPKQFARLARMQRAVLALQSRETRDLAGLALDLGYFDQAHLGRDLRDLAGVTPAMARASAGSIFPIPSLFGEPYPRP